MTRFVWIAGGVGKAGGIEELAPYFPRIEKAFLIGRDGPEFRRDPAAHGVANEMVGDVGASPCRAAFAAAQRDAAWCCSRRPRRVLTSFEFRAARRALSPRLREGAGMMPPLSRADTSVLGRWWWSVDRVTLLALGGADRHRLCAGAGGDAGHLHASDRPAYDGDDQADLLPGAGRGGDAGRCPCSRCAR